MELADQAAAVALLLVACLMGVCAVATFEVRDSDYLTVMCLTVFMLAGIGCLMGAILVLI